MKNLKAFGIASGIGAKQFGAELGVWKMFYNIQKYFPNISLEEVFFTNSIKTKLDASYDLSFMFNEINKYIIQQYKKDDQYLFFTGDHSNAIAVWSSLLNCVKKDIGIIWVDSHLDSHTPKTSDSKAIHGMPVASLLGLGDPNFANIKNINIKPENFAFIGTNSYEEAEINLIKKLGIKTYFTYELNESNINDVFKNAIDHVSKNTDYFGISLDIDSMNNSEMPGTGCFTKQGLTLQSVIANLENIYNHEKFLALEVTEFNPELDIQEKTFNGIISILKSTFNN